MTALTLPDFAPGRPAAQVDASLREALQVCDRARECAVLWFAEVQRRELHRPLGFASLRLYATEGLGFSDDRYWQFKRLADDLDRLPVLRAAVAGGTIGWTKAQQVARVATAETQQAWVATAATTGRRELAAMVRLARARHPAATAPGPQLELAPAPGGPAVPAAAPETTISLRADGLRLARFEALLEKAAGWGWRQRASTGWMWCWPGSRRWSARASTPRAPRAPRPPGSPRPRAGAAVRPAPASRSSSSNAPTVGAPLP